MAGLGPAPFGGMVLADLGADVIQVDRAAQAVRAPPETAEHNVYGRGRRSVAVDLKADGGSEVVLRLVEDADVFVEGFRPGVAERLGIGPDDCRPRNPGLVYGRMTGWGQDGPLAAKAGHDIDYIAVAGALAHIGRRGQPPTPPLNLVGDFGGGGMLLALGVLGRSVERATLAARVRWSTRPWSTAQALLLAPIFPTWSMGYWHPERGTNWLDSGAHYYDAYECADGSYVAVGAIEPQFYAQLLVGLGLADEDLPDQNDEDAWPEMKERFAAIFRSRARDEWLEVFADLDACVAPVRTMGEVGDDAHLRARETYVDVDGTLQPAPAPRFDRTSAQLDRPPAPPATTPTRSWARPASTSTRSPRSARPAPSPEPERGDERRATNRAPRSPGGPSLARI
ncbi:MAG: CaiB/BaiF CoA-transferase family protein [Acidimicrobiia bacterium]|nr:CaiB/BaiF CoA-transferase family protein [Acidimicrobiia bacterium]